MPITRTRKGSRFAFGFLCLAFACGRGVSVDPLAGPGGEPVGATGGRAGEGETSTGGESSSGAGGESRGGSGGESATGSNGAGGTGATGSSGASGSSQGGVSGSSQGGSSQGGSSQGGLGGTSVAPDGDANGTPDCTSGNDCASRVCAHDVNGEPRCCAADCRAQGRVCSTAGECVCSSRTREVNGECLLVEGEYCRESAECAGNHCVDSVCCDATCDRDCERCDAPGQAGTCVLFGEDPRCVERPGFECTARGRCRLPRGLTCGIDADCDSEQCEATTLREQICCETPCSGTCQRCGSNGFCDAYPAYDETCDPLTCPTKTACTDYRTPMPHACSGNGQCATCEPVHARAGRFCGTGEQCDGQGGCRFTGVGTVAAGLHHTCAILDNGNVVCWGLNTSGQLGAVFDRSYVGMSEEPADVSGLEIDFTHDVVQLTAGFSYTCALFDDGRVRCWGRIENELVWGTVNGVLGTTTIERNALGFVDPVRTGDVKLPEPAVQISAATGGGHTCALLTSGSVVCWGYNANGQCGNGTRVEVAALPNETLRPVQLPERAIEVRAAPGHTCALLESGNVVCWGEGAGGRLGYGDQTARLEPQGLVPIGARATQVITGLGYTCVLVDGGRVRCWGGNRDGELGYGHTVVIGDDETPEQAATMPGPLGRTYLGGDVPIGENVVQLMNVVDSRAACARFETGAVRCWGQNNRGQLGYGHAELLGRQYTPSELALRPAGSRVAGGDVDFGGLALVLAEGGRCTLRLDGALFCWGDNEDAELGLPAQVPRGSMTLTPIEMGPVRYR